MVIAEVLTDKKVDQVVAIAPKLISEKQRGLKQPLSCDEIQALVAHQVEPYLDRQYRELPFDLGEYRERKIHELPHILNSLMQDEVVSTAVTYSHAKLLEAAFLIRSKRRSSKERVTINAIRHLMPGVVTNGWSCKEPEQNGYDEIPALVAISKAAYTGDCTSYRGLVRGIEDPRAAVVAGLPTKEIDGELRSPYVFSWAGDIIVTVDDPLTGRTIALHQPGDGESDRDIRRMHLRLFSTIFRGSAPFELNTRCGEAGYGFPMEYLEPSMGVSLLSKSAMSRKPPKFNNLVAATSFQTVYKYRMKPIPPEVLMQVPLNRKANGGLESLHKAIQKYVISIDGVDVREPQNQMYVQMANFARFGTPFDRFLIMPESIDYITKARSFRGSHVPYYIANTDYADHNIRDISYLARDVKTALMVASGATLPKRISV